ncbi:MAG: hypothetical protein JW717_10730 [Marinilabiliaceae bacterium]|nr:hypothetical protein [Marinilabiliaceae bacterium]
MLYVLIIEARIDMKVDKFRADGGSYKLSILQVINKYANKFYIRANMNQSLEEAISQIKEWKKIELDEHTIYRGSIDFSPFQKIAKRNKQEDLVKPYRLVVLKEPRDDG